MKITLINPPQLNVLDDRQYAPIGLLYLASALRQDNFEVNIIDLASKKVHEWSDLINDDADIYGMICFTPAVGHVKKLVSICREKNPECLTVVGGPHASAVPEDTLAFTKCDTVAVGEGEVSFPKFVKRYQQEGKYERILYGSKIQDLDSLKYPSRDLVDNTTYTARLFNKKTTGIISARGCPYKCSFCDKGVFGPNMRFRSADNFLGELKEVKEKYGYESFFFYDDIFTINHKRLRKLLKGIEELDIQFISANRVNLMTKEILRDLHKAGCVKVAYGIESGSQKVLDMVNKKTTVQQQIDSIKAAKDEGLYVKCYFIFGLPGEDEQTVEETKKLIEIAQPDQANLYTFQPYPGSDIWNRPDHYGVEIVNKDFENYYMVSTDGTGGINYRLKNMSDEKFIELRDDLARFIRSKDINRPEPTSNV